MKAVNSSLNKKNNLKSKQSISTINSITSFNMKLNIFDSDGDGINRHGDDTKNKRSKEL